MTYFQQLQSFFTFSSSSQSAKRQLKQLQLTSSSSLPQSYLTLLSSSKQCTAISLLLELIQQLSKASTAPTVIKTLTLILAITKASNYGEAELQILQKIQVPKLLKQRAQDQWLFDISSCWISYLAKLSSLHDIYQRAISHKTTQINFTIFQTDFYLLLNQLRLLFPKLNSGLNNIGRYYKASGQYFQQFYRVMRVQVLLGYGYMKWMLDEMVQGFKGLGLEGLGCLMEGVPEIQLLCDELEVCLMNKYFKGKRLRGKIEFKAEDIEQIMYYLRSENKKKMDGLAMWRKNSEADVIC